MQDAKVKSARRAGMRAAPPAGTPRQSFTVSHHREEDFATGLRRYAHYRDLGMAKATNGMVQAQVGA